MSSTPTQVRAGTRSRNVRRASTTPNRIAVSRRTATGATAATVMAQSARAWDARLLAPPPRPRKTSFHVIDISPRDDVVKLSAPRRNQARVGNAVSGTIHKA